MNIDQLNIGFQSDILLASCHAFIINIMLNFLGKLIALATQIFLEI